MFVASILWLALLGGALDEQRAAARLDELEHGYALQPGPTWEALALAVAEEAPQTNAAGRALLWLGALAQHGGRFALASERYAEARRRFPRGDIAALAARGLGDVALAQHRWGEAIARYDEAAPQATAVLAQELVAKRAFAARARVLARAERASFGIGLFVLAWFARAAKRWRWAVPIETRYLLPLYGLLVLAAWGRDPKVLAAMLWIGGGSLVLVTAGFADPTRPRRHPVFDGVAFLLGTAAVIFVGLSRAGLWDAVLESVGQRN